MLAEAQALSSRLAALSEVAVAIQRELDTEDVLKTFAREARWVLDFHLCSVVLLEGDTLVEQVLRASGPESQMPVLVRKSAGAVMRALSTGQAQLIRDSTPQDALPPDVRSAIILPLRNQNDIIGTVNFVSYDREAYSLDDLRIAYALAMQVAVVLQNARLLRATRIARDELNTVLESISDGVLVLDMQGRVLLMNTALRRMLLLGNRSFEGQTAIRVLRNAPLFDRSSSRARLLRTFRTQWREKAGGVVQAGARQWLEWAGVPLGGRPDGFVMTVRDISQQIELEQLRDDLTGMLVHDLRTPLTSIIMGLDMMKLYMDQSLLTDAQEVMEYSQSSSRRLLTMINTLLDVRKLQAGHVALERTDVALAALAAGAITSVAYQAQQAELQIDLAIDPAAIVGGDADLIRRMLENLLSNAIKFSPPGSTITVTAAATRHGLEISVRDCGPGVPQAQRETIFEMYGQARSEDARRGTGLGLTFCRLVAETHGGAIGVRPAPGGGSDFWFTLPYPRPDQH